MITAHHLIYRPARCPRDLLNLDTLHFAAGEFHALIGANGAGKSTLLRALSGDLPQLSENIHFNTRKLSQFSAAELARWRAVLPQSLSVAFPISAAEVVAFGRNIYHQEKAAQADAAVMAQVMDWLGITEMANSHYQQLSGGEQHRTHIARTLAQLIAYPDEDLTGKVLFLDEPTNHLDIRHQYALLKLLKQLQKRGLTIICVLHDLTLALNYSEKLLLLCDGKSTGHFTPEELISSGALDNAYHLTMNAHWSTHYRRFVVMPEYDR